MTEATRLHSLDNLRAIMMWLGIVLHVSLNHIVGESPAPWRDPQTSLVADFLIAIIHAFRMPVFFVLGGYFVSMLISQRGSDGMLRHRLRRLALPFAVFWPIIFPAMGLVVLVYVHQMVRGSIGIDLSLAPKPPNGPLINTMHLWFLYMLMWFCVFTAGAHWLRQFLPSSLGGSTFALLYQLATAWWGALVLAIPLALVGVGYRAGLVTASGSFTPHLTEWVQNGMFFLVGLALYERREAALAFFEKNCWRYAIAGIFFFLAWIALYEASQSSPGLSHLS
jgi:glucans biosynthesis protein C